MRRVVRFLKNVVYPLSITGRKAAREMPTHLVSSFFRKTDGESMVADIPDCSTPVSSQSIVEAFDDKRCCPSSSCPAVSPWAIGGREESAIDIVDEGKGWSNDDKEGGRPPTAQSNGARPRKCVDSPQRVPAARGLKSRKVLRFVIYTGCLLTLFFLALLFAYLGMVATIPPPFVTLQPSTLKHLAFDGPYMNAVVSLGAEIENKSIFQVTIQASTVLITYHQAALGMVQLPTMHLHPSGSFVHDTNATFYRVNTITGPTTPGKREREGEEGGEEGGSATTPLGKRLMDEVLGKQSSTLKLEGHVSVRAHVVKRQGFPAVPINLRLACVFENQWGGRENRGEGGREEEREKYGAGCETTLHPFWWIP